MGYYLPQLNSSVDPNAPAPSSGGGGGSMWNPFNALHAAYDYVNPVGGVKQLVTGIASSFAAPIVNAGYGVKDLVTGNISQAGHDFGQAGRGVGDLGTGFLTGAEGVGADAFHLIPGASQAYDSTFQAINKAVGGLGINTTAGTQGLMGPNGQGAKPQDLSQLASNEGLLAGVVTQAGVLAPFGGAIAGAATGALGGAMDAADAASAAAEASGTAADAATAASAADRVSSLTRQQAVGQAIHNPIKFAGVSIAHFLEANKAAGLPAEGAVPVTDPITGLATQPPATEPTAPPTGAEAIGATSVDPNTGAPVTTPPPVTEPGVDPSSPAYAKAAASVDPVDAAAASMSQGHSALADARAQAAGGTPPTVAELQANSAARVEAANAAGTRGTLADVTGAPARDTASGMTAPNQLPSTTMPITPPMISTDGAGASVNVPLDRVVAQQGSIDSARVADIVKKGLNDAKGAAADPITVVDAGNGNWLSEGGNHRIAAAMANGETSIPATVTGTVTDATLVDHIQGKLDAAAPEAGATATPHTVAELQAIRDSFKTPSEAPGAAGPWADRAEATPQGRLALADRRRATMTPEQVAADVQATGIPENVGNAQHQWFTEQQGHVFTEANTTAPGVTGDVPPGVPGEPVDPGAKLKIPNKILKTPEEIAAEKADLIAQQDAAQAAQNPTAVEDAVGKKIAMPPPAWATRLAQALPDAVNQLLGHLAGHYVDRIRMKDFANSLRQAVEVAHQRTRTSPFMSASQAAGADLIAQFSTMSDPAVSHAVGEQIASIASGESLVKALAARLQGMNVPPEMRTKLMVTASRGYAGITDAMRKEIASRPGGAEALGQLDAHVAQAADLYKAEVARTTQTLLASRYGAQGLESALIDPNEVTMSSAETKVFRRALSDFRRANVLKGRIPQAIENAKAAVNVARSQGDTQSARIATLQRMRGITLQTINDLHDGVPPGVASDAAVATTVNSALADATQNFADYGGYGSTFHPGTGEVIHNDVGYNVGSANQGLTLQTTWDQRAPELLHDSVLAPKTIDGKGTYDPAHIWGGVDAHMGFWAHKSLPGAVDSTTGLPIPVGTDVVSWEISQDTIGGKPTTLAQATVLGEAWKQNALFDNVTKTDVPLSNNPAMHNLASNYVDQALNPKSAFNVVADHGAARIAGTNITPADLNAELQAAMQIDYAFHTANPSTHAIGDLFAKMDITKGLSAPRLESLTQQILNVGPTEIARYTGSTPLQAFTQIQGATQAWGDLLAHYGIASDNLDIIDNALGHGGRVIGATFDPLGDTALAGTPEYVAALKDMRGRLAAGDATGARAILTEFVAKQARGILDNTATSFDGTTAELLQNFNSHIAGATMSTATEGGRLVARLFQRADLRSLTEQNLQLIRQLAPGDMVAELSRSYPHLQDSTLTAARVADEGRFSSDFLGYLQRRGPAGNIPAGLEPLFRQLASTMHDTYSSILDTAAGRAIPNDVVDFWDRTFTPEIVRPSVITDPLVHQSMVPPGGVNPSKNPWETPTDFTNRTRQLGEARATLTFQDREIARQVQIAAKMDRATEQMLNAIGVTDKAGQLARVAGKLEARATASLGKLSDKMGNPTLLRVPVQWRPMVQAFTELAQLVKDSNNPEMAAVLSEIPANFASVMKYAAEQGFEPTHVPELTWQMANKYMFGHMTLGNTVDEAGLRKANLGVLNKKGLADRSLEALGSGSVIAMKEMLQSRLITFIEKYHAQWLPQGQEIPAGWKSWTDARQSIIMGRDAVGKNVATGPIMIIPEGVSSALKAMQADYASWKSPAFRFLMKGGPTAVWKHAILTYSPRWYIMHFVGAVSNAVLEGARLQDFMTAFRQATTKDEFGIRGASLPDVVRGRSIWGSSDEEAGTRGTVIKRSGAGAPNARPTVASMPDLIKAEGYRAAGRAFNESLRNVVKQTDAMGRAAVYAKTLRLGGTVEQAAARSYAALGDFGNLSAFERDAVSAVMPFYGFQKAMFRIMARLPVDHPLAAGMLMRTGAVNQQYLEQKLGGSIPDSLIGTGVFDGKLTSIAKINPLVDTFKLVTPAGIAQSLHPFVQLFAEQATGAPVFNAQAGMGTYGQLTMKPDIGQTLQDALLNTPAGGAGSSIVGMDPATLAQMLIPNMGRTYSDAQYQALIKRIKDTQKAEATVAGGGYLKLDAYKPAKNPKAPTPAEAQPTG